MNEQTNVKPITTAAPLVKVEVDINAALALVDYYIRNIANLIAQESISSSENSQIDHATNQLKVLAEFTNTPMEKIHDRVRDQARESLLNHKYAEMLDEDVETAMKGFPGYDIFG